MRKRMKTVRGLWAGLLAAAVVLTSAAPSALTVQAEEADAVQTAEVSGVEYQIYPTPHEMTYQDGGFDIGEVNIVYENGVDDVTKNRMTEVLSKARVRALLLPMQKLTARRISLQVSTAPTDM